MTEFIAPGVYVEETLTPNRSISGVSTTTAAFVGRTRRGPVFGITDSFAPQPLTSVSDFQRIYGGFHAIGGTPNYLALAVRAYFDNGGRKLYVSRVAELPDPTSESAEAAQTIVDTGLPDVSGRTGRAQSTLVIANDDPTQRMSFAARFPGEAGNATIVITQNASQVTQASIDAAPIGSLLRLVHSAIASVARPVSSIAASAQATVAMHPAVATLAKPATPSIASTIASTRPIAAATQPVHPAIGVLAGPTTPAPQVAAVTSTSYYLKGADGWRDASNALLDSTTLNSSFSTTNGAALLTMTVAPTDADGITNMTMAGLGFDARHPSWLGAKFASRPANSANAIENFVEVRIGRNVDAFALHAGLFANGDAITVTLQQGADGPAPTVIAYQRALTAFERLRDVSTVAAPDAAAFTDTLPSVNAALVAHAERPGAFRIALLDTAAGLSASQALAAKAAFNSSYAALYYPWVIVANPTSPTLVATAATTVAIPPSGIVAGIFARSDLTRSVAKAPANQAVQGAVRLEHDLNDAEQDLLNPAGVNALRTFPGRGTLVWGARTTSSDSDWKYVNVRRYMIYLEQSIDSGTQWTVFEPNGPALWSSINASVSNFLMNEWKSGATLGDKAEQAFFVRCDTTTMTQDDLDNGRLICVVGVAPVKPAEFVVVRIGQWTGSSTVGSQGGSQSGSQNSDGSDPDP
jgi:phage tail sheath protein FI